MACFLPPSPCAGDSRAYSLQEHKSVQSLALIGLIRCHSRDLIRFSNNFPLNNNFFNVRKEGVPRGKEKKKGKKKNYDKASDSGEEETTSTTQSGGLFCSPAVYA